MTSKAKIKFGIAIWLLCLTGCTVGPDFEKPSANPPEKWADFPAVKQYEQSVPSKILEAPLEKEWWRQFNDPLLSTLIERAINKNMTLRNASALLAQSRALRGIASADQFPSLNGNASYSRLQPSKKGILSLSQALGGSSATFNSAGMGTSANGTGVGAIGFPAVGVQPFNLYQYGFDASWELDLWGRVQRELESADAAVEASLEQHHSAQLSVIAEVARNYIELRRLQGNRSIAAQQRDIAQEQLELAGYKVARGVATDIDVETAKNGLANAQAQLPQLDQQIEQTLNQLSLLLSEQPGALTVELSTPQPIPAIPAQVNIGLPSELALRRPDIREAQANLHKALANIGMATADFYPRFTLSGSAGFQALRLKDLANWSALQYAIGPSIMLPIFQGGRLVSTLELRQAEHQQAAIAYRNTVLTAWHDIDNTLSAYNEAQRREQALAAALQSNTEALNLKQQRYRQGVTDFVPVLQAKSARLQAEQSEIDGASATATNMVALYKTLGGGWRMTQEQETEINKVEHHEEKK